MSRAFTRFAAGCAFVAAAGTLVYAISFLSVLESGGKGVQEVNAIALGLGGIIAVVVYVALYERLRAVDAGFALVGLIFGVAGSAGAALHGGFNIGALLKSNVAASAGGGTDPGLPSQADPRGLATFLFAAIAVAVFAWLMRQPSPAATAFPRNLSTAGLVGAALLVVVYVGRLTVLRPKAPVLYAALLVAGFLSGPLWFAWIGRLLSRSTDA